MAYLKRFAPLILKVVGVLAAFFAGKEHVAALIPQADPGITMGGEPLSTWVLGLLSAAGIGASQYLSGGATAADPEGAAVFRIKNPEVSIDIVLTGKSATDAEGLKCVGETVKHYANTPTAKVAEAQKGAGK